MQKLEQLILCGVMYYHMELVQLRVAVSRLNTREYVIYDDSFDIHSHLPFCFHLYVILSHLYNERI